ncbi:MAG: meso-butanediol dehydrogenase/(S,S)-butanediol dehydrogenase/diacetyl reductase [Halieaceae bacterium]|jgi:meso-butanediol dehydrogenase/(S,S)-butanediol dehydrogenase/diacetyl reductase
MKRFEKKTALITGAASGIGRATAMRLAGEGAAVFCLDLQEEELAETARLILDRGGNAAALRCDVTSEAEVKFAVSSCVEQFGGIDNLSNIAGILRFDHFHEAALADFEQIMKVNVNGLFLMCRESIPHLLESGGNIVNVSSTSALAGVPWAGAYSASKGAVLAMTRSIAIEYVKQGMRANCVCPGDIVTPMTSPTFPEGIDLTLMQRCMSPSGRRGPEVVAGVIAMLASDDGAHINGEYIRMDGGTLS